MLTHKKTILCSLGLLFLLPAAALAQGGCNPDETTTKLCNPFGSQVDFFGMPLAGAANLPDLIIRLLIIFTSFTALIPILVVVAAGFQMIVSQGNAEAVKRAKTAFSYAVYGFIVAVLSFVLVAGMINFFGATEIPDPANPSFANRVVNPINEPTFVDFLVNRLLAGFLQIVGLLAILMLVFNGFRYITAAGDEEQLTEAKAALKWISAGIVAILFAYVIIRAAANLIGAPS
ncbi:MAG: hypothetical protein HYV13_01865 [Candidatus Doudnabacteria bacterium]|nr:hypothetical protein [Candidatus Doudnabacteria bacterium]